jgi:hypothetical protein
MVPASKMRSRDHSPNTRAFLDAAARRNHPKRQLCCRYEGVADIFVRGAKLGDLPWQPCMNYSGESFSADRVLEARAGAGLDALASIFGIPNWPPRLASSLRSIAPSMFTIVSSYTRREGLEDAEISM